MVQAIESRNITEGSSTQTTLKILQTLPTLIILEYDLLPDTNPGANGNFAAIWQNTNNIPFNQKPDATVPIPGASQHGQFEFPVDLTRNNYIVGYAVGPELAAPSQKYGNICSTEFIAMAPKLGQLEENEVAKAEPSSAFFSNLTVGIVTSDLVSVKYEVPINCRPADNKAWLGLFRGDASYNSPPEKAVAISSNDDSGFMTIRNKMIFDKKYTIALFMSGWSETTRIQTRMAATTWFKA